MTTATLTPYDLSTGEKIGRRLYRKQVLKKGVITYKGQTIKFDDAFLTDLAASFKAGAYDQVPFVLADPENRHNEDPERFRGEVTKFEVTKDGLDAIVKVNKQGAKVLEDNPNLGVSARIVQGVAKADGRTFGRAIRHVLGTMDPRITGLRPWQAVDLSEDDDTEVVDLTAETYQEDGVSRRSKSKDAPAATPEIDLSALSDEEFLRFLDLTDEDPDAVPDPAAATEDDPDGTGDETIDDPASGDAVTDVDPDSVGDDGVTDDDDDDDDEDTDPAPVNSGGDTGDTDLSEDIIDSGGRDEMTQMRVDLAAERYKSERKDLLRAGVPPFLLDLAEPLLASPDQVVMDLSNADEPVNATEIIRQVLNGVKGMIDLTPEIGHKVDLSVEQESGEDALLTQWEKEYGTA